MPDQSIWIDIYSRYQYADIYTTDDGDLFITERQPMESPGDGSYVEHLVKADDTLFSLAGHYYNGLIDRAAGLWWAIMEANGIVDPTKTLRTGTTLKIPDFQYVISWIGYRHEISG